MAHTGLKDENEADHIVPLYRQSLAILEELRAVSGTEHYVFPAARGNAGAPHLQTTTPLRALRRLGYGKGELTFHGFRSMASTLLNELVDNRDWIERQLAHSESNSVRAAYNYAEYLPERCKIMQEWSNYLYGLREQAKGKG